MVDTFLVPEKTVAQTKGDGQMVDVSGASNRVFLLSLNITGIVEQESLDVSIHGSGDGTTWSPKPVTNFPQKFYQAQHPLLLTSSSDPQFQPEDLGSLLEQIDKCDIVCSNCHRMLHQGGDLLTISALKATVMERRSSR